MMYYLGINTDAQTAKHISSFLSDFALLLLYLFWFQHPLPIYKIWFPTWIKHCNNIKYYWPHVLRWEHWPIVWPGMIMIKVLRCIIHGRPPTRPSPSIQCAMSIQCSYNTRRLLCYYVTTLQSARDMIFVIHAYSFSTAHCSSCDAWGSQTWHFSGHWHIVQQLSVHLQLYTFLWHLITRTQKDF